MLQLRNEKCLFVGIHPCSIRHGSRPSLPAALRINAFLERHELGYLKMATIDRRQIVPAVARFVAF